MHIPTLRMVIMVKIVHIIIEFLQYVADKRRLWLNMLKRQRLEFLLKCPRNNMNYNNNNNNQLTASFPWQPG